MLFSERPQAGPAAVFSSRGALERSWALSCRCCPGRLSRCRPQPQPCSTAVSPLWLRSALCVRRRAPPSGHLSLARASLACANLKAVQLLKSRGVKQEKYLALFLLIHFKLQITAALWQWAVTTDLCSALDALQPQWHLVQNKLQPLFPFMSEYFPSQLQNLALVHIKLYPGFFPPSHLISLL